ncbi:MAG: tagaturonate reductase [Clostridia bacterium]|nr:tagaturonate reductase [Clostridia bacterium]
MDSIRNRFKKTPRPVRVVQFGEGNFLRAFADHMLDIANEQGAFNGSVAIVKPRAHGNLDAFRQQDCLYTVVLRGRENGGVVNTARAVTCIDRIVSPYEEPDCLTELGGLDTLEYIISNTTEAGISLTGDEQLTDRPCASFPGKLTQLLYARYRRFEGDMKRGVVVLPAELIDRNGSALKKFVLELTGKWALEEGFVRWLNEACLFLNTLVDRIVTGFPAAEADALYESLGYEDKLLTVGEPFGLWVIECEEPEKMSARLPLDRIGLPVVYTKDLTPYRERKVRILNGAHTSSVLAAYLAGENIVRDMMNSPLLRPLIDRAVYEELLPTVPLPEDEVRAFADAVAERFDNPFIDHQLLAISLNSISKWRARVLPSVKDTLNETGRLPEALVFSLAALIAFYTPVEQGDNCLLGRRGDETYPIRDSQPVLDFFWTHRKEENTEALVRALAARTDFWGEDLNALPGLTERAAYWLDIIRNEGMRSSVARAAEERK